MDEQRERRQQPRTALPWRIAARVRDVREVRLLDLSLGGTRLEHLGLLRPGAHCEVELPALLGGLTLPARIAWSAVIGRRRGLDGHPHLLSHTGLRFAPLPASQAATLADALQRVMAHQRALDRRQGSA
jgi:hypothetical protein